MSEDPQDCWPFDPTRPESPVAAGCVSWGEAEQREPELLSAARSRFETTRHHVLATLRADGSPRVSGTEVTLRDGVLVVGSMHRAVKTHDLQRDGRFALHSNPGDGSMDGGDAKVSGVATELGGTLAAALAAQLRDEAPDHVPEPFHLFRLDIAQVVVTEVDQDRHRLVVRSWRPDRGLVTTER